MTLLMVISIFTGKETLAKAKYDWIGPFSEGLAPVNSYGGYGYIDKKGKEIVELKYDNAHGFSSGFAVVALNKDGSEKEGIIDKTGKEVMEARYDVIYGFESGLSTVKNGGEIKEGHYREGGKQGLIDIDGKEILPVEYDDAGYFEEGIIPMRKGDIWSLFDKTGNELVKIR